MPNWKELRRYLRRNGWIMYKNTDHEYYRKEVRPGEFIYTRCSHGSKEIHYNMWQSILKHELGITQEEFNANK
ncbi:MAG: type II toxin-antitoxin system HicA family toxin [Synergistaceae bacterium]|nr:type II toxin-antitoxin system HicA family toxin [Synergistaceae bacterium]MBR0203032.1 type II toxin-antitoxin system HicA family toxin [Synergistaceae bacterium]